MTIETEESVVLRNTKGRQTSLMWCPICRLQVEMATPEQAAQIAGVTTRTIYRWVEAERIHFVEARDAPLLICKTSLCDSKSAQGAGT